MILLAASQFKRYRYPTNCSFLKPKNCCDIVKKYDIQVGLKFVYSQCIGNWLIFGFLATRRHLNNI
jgi:hypothetical protein